MNNFSIENQLLNISFLLILITLIIYWLNLIITDLNILKQISKFSTIIINLCLSISLIYRWINNHYFPLSNLYESLVFLTWGLTFIQLILEKQNQSKLIGAINLPIALFTIGFASLALPNEMKEASPLVPALRSNWLMMHVSVMMISYSTLIIGSLLSILFLIVSKGKNIELQGSSYNTKIKTNFIINSISRKYNRLNLLESIDNLSYRVIGLGFPLLTIGIISGAVWANEAWGSYWSWDPKETWALITWLIFAIYLHTRLNKAWNGKKPALIASLGFIVVWICYLGVNFLGKGLHSYGWIL
uniref:Cytochrome c biogenesis protein CcsA n=1 Tax=Ceramothamnion japonicum TaxID=218448 RepID=A0A1C9CDC6_CERJP|nr:cytochrome c biogenesis protein [Ceramium japonicum]AOM66354.1 cytochrome c biogenesis protein [Ceramium japonicum]